MKISIKGYNGDHTTTYEGNKYDVMGAVLRIINELTGEHYHIQYNGEAWLYNHTKPIKSYVGLDKEIHREFVEDMQEMINHIEYINIKG